MLNLVANPQCRRGRSEGKSNDSSGGEAEQGEERKSRVSLQNHLGPNCLREIFLDLAAGEEAGQEVVEQSCLIYATACRSGVAAPAGAKKFLPQMQVKLHRAGLGTARGVIPGAD
ncbi:MULTISPECIES: hypothetical protein [Novosphingobium]|uniref:hypothetical protein n=1 Tax=Novosphingobium TaxID=165696 RepID=UPI0012E05A5E|nr:MULTISPECIES: hypothetical protein [Novosphingobium]